jgi:YVTN family beta-propeller protein
VYIVDDAVGVFLIDITKNDSLSLVPSPFDSPVAIAWDGGTGMYVSNVNNRTVGIIDINTGAITTNTLSSIPEVIAWDGATGMYVVSGAKFYVININTLQTSASPSTGLSFTDITWDGATGMYLCDPTDNKILVVNTQTPFSSSSTLSVTDASQSAWDGTTGMFVNNTDNNTVVVLNTRTFQSASSLINVGIAPQALAWDGATGMYIVNLGSNDVSVIDTKTFQVVNTIPVGLSPASVTRVLLSKTPFPSGKGPLLVITNLSNIADATMQVTALGSQPIASSPMTVISGKGTPDISADATLTYTVSDNSGSSSEVILDFPAGSVTLPPKTEETQTVTNQNTLVVNIRHS